MNVLDVLCVQLTRDLFAIAKFLFIDTADRHKTDKIRVLALTWFPTCYLFCFLFCLVPNYSFVYLIILETKIKESQDNKETEGSSEPHQSQQPPQPADENKGELQEQQTKVK